MQASRTIAGALTPAELAAWRGLLRLHARLVRELDLALQAREGITLSEYEVLIHLADTPGGRMRMTELAAALVVTQSGVTRIVDRLARDGLVVRERCEEDRRGWYATITAAGLTLLERARPAHRDDVRERFLRHFTPRELELLGGFWERLEPAQPQD
ncbi:MAG: MarR family transcriptional regulator [Thermoleophilia bacterium]